MTRNERIRSDADEAKAIKHDDRKPRADLIPWQALASAKHLPQPVLAKDQGGLLRMLSNLDYARQHKAPLLVPIGDFICGLRSQGATYLGAAAVLEFGARKYGERNWERGEGLGIDRVLNAAVRHVTAVIDGEELDTETGLKHLDHALCEALFALHYVHAASEKPGEKREKTRVRVYQGSGRQAAEWSFSGVIDWKRIATEARAATKGKAYVRVTTKKQDLFLHPSSSRFTTTFYRGSSGPGIKLRPIVDAPADAVFAARMLDPDRPDDAHVFEVVGE